MFLRNYWYVGGLAKDVGAKPVAVTVCNEPLVLFRGASGKLGCLGDRCPHKRAPLSMGKVVGDAVECPYHGQQFDGAGKCVRIPGQDHVPPLHRTGFYPVVERWGWIWVWIGDAGRADETLIPDFSPLNDPAWARIQHVAPTKCDYRLWNDNLLDLTHVDFAHSVVGVNANYHLRPTEFIVKDDTVTVHQWQNDMKMPAWHEKLFATLGFTEVENIDANWVWHPPCYVLAESVTTQGGPAAAGNTRRGRMRYLHALIPETETTSILYYSLARDFDLGNQLLTDFMTDTVHRTCAEDVVMLEAVQRMIDSDPRGAGHGHELTVRMDKGVLKAREILTRLEREQAGERPRLVGAGD